jgi:hypothetical protein
MHAIFDYFAKLVAEEGLAPACASTSEHEVRHDAQRADLFVEPDPKRFVHLAPLGLLGRLCRRPCTLEFIHGTPGPRRVEACIGKILAFRKQRRRAKRREPVQRILTSGVPRAALRDFGFRPARGWGPGVYSSPRCLATLVVVASELPVTRDTLLVRLIAGSDSVLEQAKAEVMALPADALERRLAAGIVVKLKPRLGDKRAQEFRAMMQPMLYTYDRMIAEHEEKARAEARAEALVEGRAEEFVRSFLAVYEARFGAVPRGIAAAATAADDPAVRREWLRLAATGSAEDVAAALRGARAPAKKRAPAPAAKRRAKA